MTTIHAVPTKRRHFPVTKHHSLYRKDTGWLVEPGQLPPNLTITDEGGSTAIDICIPGVTKDRVDVMGRKPCIKKSVHSASQEEMIHIVFPPKGSKVRKGEL